MKKFLEGVLILAGILTMGCIPIVVSDFDALFRLSIFLLIVGVLPYKVSSNMTDTILGGTIVMWFSWFLITYAEPLQGVLF